MNSMEPTKIRSGDTVRWRKTVPGYLPADGWALSYFLVGDGSRKEITSVPDDDSFIVTLPAADNDLKAGHYALAGRVTKDGEVYTIFEGSVEVLPNLAEGSVTDARTHAERVLAAIEAVIEGRATKDQEEYSIEGRSLKRTPMESLIKFRALYKREVAQLRRAERAANGIGSSRKIRIAFR